MPKMILMGIVGLSVAATAAYGATPTDLPTREELSARKAEMQAAQRSYTGEEAVRKLRNANKVSAKLNIFAANLRAKLSPSDMSLLLTYARQDQEFRKNHSLDKARSYQSVCERAPTLSDRQFLESIEAITDRFRQAFVDYYDGLFNGLSSQGRSALITAANEATARAKVQTIEERRISDSSPEQLALDAKLMRLNCNLPPVPPPEAREKRSEDSPIQPFSRRSGRGRVRTQ